MYASTVVTELFFRQAVGRLVRWISGLPNQKAYVYLPDDPRLRSHAFQIAEARRHVLRPPATDEGDDEFEPAAIEREAMQELNLLPEQLSLFSVLSSTATGMTVHAFTEHGITYDDEPEVPEPDGSVAFGDVLELPAIPTDAGFQLVGSKSVADRKEELREQNLAVAKSLVDFTGWSHGKVQKELNRLAGIESVGSATNRQLEQRARHGEAWLRRR